MDPKGYLDNLSESEFYDNFLINDEDCFFRFCKSVLISGTEIEMFILSSKYKDVRTYRHNHGFNITRLPTQYNSGNWGKEISLNVFSAIKNNNFDLVIASPLYALNKGIDMCDLVSLFCRIRNIPFIPYYGGSSFSSNKGIIGSLKRIRKLITLSLSSRVICQSKNEINLIKKNRFINSDKWIHINNPFDFSYFKNESKEIAIRKLNLDPDYKYILFIGRIAIEKQIDRVIKLMPTFMEKYKVKFLIAGTGPEKGRLLNLSKDLGVERNVQFLGHVEYKNLNNYYNSADCFVLPSLSEGTPNVLIEGLSCNTRMVASDVGGVSDILSEGVGEIVPHDDDSKLKNSIERCLESKFEINQKKREAIMSTCNLDYSAVRLKRIFEAVVKS